MCKFDQLTSVLRKINKKWSIIRVQFFLKNEVLLDLHIRLFHAAGGAKNFDPFEACRTPLLET